MASQSPLSSDRVENILKGRLALVTGSTSGIGLAIAKALAPKIDGLLLHGIATEEQIKSARECILEANPQLVVHFHGANLSVPAEIQSMVQFFKENFKRMPDILVNNAGCQHVSPIEEFPDDKWDQLIAVNLSASFHTIKHILPGMRERGWGRIVNIASVLGTVAAVNKAAYVASKHGLVGLTKVVALETVSSGVTCNVICPCWAQTAMTTVQFETIAKKEGLSVEEATSKIVRGDPAKKLLDPSEIGDMVVYLCSQSARHISGTTLHIDDGWTAM